MNRADVIVVGAGVLGASVAHHLTQLGVERVVVLEREAEPGLGSTGRATGGFRALFGSTINAKLSILARDRLASFTAETGADSGYRPTGYLFVATSDEQRARLARAAEVSRAAGVDAITLLDANDVIAHNPVLCPEAIVGGAFCAWGGSIQPLALLGGYLDAAKRAGAKLRDCGAIEILERHGRVTGVKTIRGTISAKIVVHAAGAWAADLPAALGVALPVAPLRRQVAITETWDGIPPDAPLTVFLEDGFDFRVRDGRVLLLWPADTGAPLSFDTTFEPNWLDGLLPRATRRIPSLSEAEIDRERCWTGLYEMSPDGHALLGSVPAIDGLHVIGGASGHGVMHAPALGLLLAEQIVHGEARSLDAHALRPTRFLERDPVTSVHLV